MINVKRFCKELDKNKIKYDTGQLKNGKQYVSINVSTKNIDDINLHVYLDCEKSNTATFRFFEICRIMKRKKSDMLVLLNELNQKHRWATFYITTEGRIAAVMNYYSSKKRDAKVLCELLDKTIAAVDASYTEIIGTLYV